jgi:hypothetical protein
VYVQGATHFSNSYARSRARVAGWKPLTNRIRGAIVCRGGRERAGPVACAVGWRRLGSASASDVFQRLLGLSARLTLSALVGPCTRSNLQWTSVFNFDMAEFGSLAGIFPVSLPPVGPPFSR